MQLAVLEGARVGSDKPLKKHARLRLEGLSSWESSSREPSLAQMPRIAAPVGLIGVGVWIHMWSWESDLCLVKKPFRPHFWHFFCENPEVLIGIQTIVFFEDKYLESSCIHLSPR